MVETCRGLFQLEATAKAKSARVKTGTITKEEEAQRLELEDKLRGKNDKLVPPLYLTESQMEIFNQKEGLIPRSLLRNKLFQDMEEVIY